MNECLFTYTLAVTIKMHAVHTLHSMYKYSNCIQKISTNATYIATCTIVRTLLAKLYIHIDTHVILKWDGTPIQLLYHQTSYGIITIWPLSNLAAHAEHLFCL